MTKAILRLGPKEQPNGQAIVQILFQYPDPPPNRFYVCSLTTGKHYTVFLDQLSEIQTIPES